MAQKNAKKRPEMTWQVADVTNMSSFEKTTFDLVIDKSTIDCLFCSENYMIKVASVLKDIQRVLKIGGHYFGISMEQPEHRLSHFKSKFLSWDCK